MPKPTNDERIDKRRVTMKSVSLGSNGETITQVATDYVRPDVLDAYVADAKTRWQYVEVSEEFDAGPAGYAGETNVPRHLAGKSASDFARYGDASTPENALDEQIAQGE